ncbi:MAG: sugar porter family MFS transporter [Pirellulales bacterium]|nr:sugar porter family MFS transporter [Pirellulales bacterium]
MHGILDAGGSDRKAEYRRVYVWTISLVAAMGGLLFGYDWIVISGTDIFYEAYFNLTVSWIIGWAKSCAIFGCLLGAITAGALSDRFGRKRLLIFSALLFGVSAVATGLTSTFFWFVFWRIMGGMAIGLASNLSPMYIAEVAPAQTRGRLVGLNQLTIVIGILLAQFVNWQIASLHPLPDLSALAGPENAAEKTALIAASWPGQIGWRWMFAVTAAPAMLFFLGMFFVPETPRWLIKSGRTDQAKNILAKLGGSRYAADAAAEIEASLRNEVGKVNYRELLEPRMLTVLVLGVGLAVLQQFCGINVIFYYAKNVFQDAGYPIDAIFVNIVYLGSVNLLFTLVALGIVDRVGRRPLMLLGFGGLTILWVILGGCFAQAIHGLLVLTLVLIALACYAMTLAPVVWVLIAEIFPNRIRGAAMSVAVMGLWIANFLLTETFPLLWGENGEGAPRTFWIYAGICLIGFFFVLFRLTETKGKSLEEIEKDLLGSRED